jgi:hypothetical protein
MNTRQRVAEFLKRLNDQPPAQNLDEAREILAGVLTEVEDELCSETDERMGPPLDDNRRSVAGKPDVTRYRTKGHNVFYRSNGAIRIEELPSKAVVLDKPGADGKKAFDP